MKTLTRESILDTWKNVFDMIPEEGICTTCGKLDLVQHQGICVECMLKSARITEQIKEDNKNKCAMCGRNHIAKPSKTIPYLMDNVCNKCLRNVV